MWRLLGLLLTCVPVLVSAQLPLTSNYYNYHLYDRIELLSDSINPLVHSSAKPYRRDRLKPAVFDWQSGSEQDRFNQRYLNADNGIYPAGNLFDPPSPPQTGWHGFYRYPNHLYALHHHKGRLGSLSLSVDPILAFGTAADSEDSLGTYRNSRGVVMEGSIGNKIGFFTRAVENQYRFPSYQRQRIDERGVVEGAGFIKPFGEGGHDFFEASGYVTYSPIKEVMLQFGHDRHFFGNGYRSMIWSDRAVASPFLKFSTQVWRLQYTNLFSQLVDYRLGDADPIRTKFSAFHHLSLNVTDRLNIGFFEHILFDRQDSTENGQFDFNYLNPIIFYRAVEHGLNSTDNAMLGMDWKWNFYRGFSFYGQVVFDEFVKKEFFGASDHWANKWAYQAGLKYLDVGGISNLDLQAEINQARPFVYTHKAGAQNWNHYNQSMAHPLGANFREYVGILRYQPIPRLEAMMLWTLSRQGVDSTAATNRYGANVLLSNRDVASKQSAPMFQGVRQDLTQLGIRLSYMFHHNLFLDVGYHYRHWENALYGKQDNRIFSVGLRLNAYANRYLD